MVSFGSQFSRPFFLENPKIPNTNIDCTKENSEVANEDSNKEAIQNDSKVLLKKKIKIQTKRLKTKPLHKKILKKLSILDNTIKEINKAKSIDTKKLENLSEKIDELRDTSAAQKFQDLYEKSQKNLAKSKERNKELKEKKENVEAENKALTIQVHSLKFENQKALQQMQDLSGKNQILELHYINLLNNYNSLVGNPRQQELSSSQQSTPNQNQIPQAPTINNQTYLTS